MKLTTWNAKWLDTDWGVVHGVYTPGQDLFPHKAPTKAKAEQRIKAVGTFIEMLDADILFLCEAPKSECVMKAFVSKVAKGYDLVFRPGNQSYHTNGRQWQWFLVKKDLASQISPELVPVPTWRDFASAPKEALMKNGSGKWKVAMPKLSTVGGVKDVPVSTRVSHDFDREPQVLRFTFGGARHEIIGAHLKSKFTGSSPPKRQPGEDFDKYLKDHKTAREFVAKAHGARVKLSSEATVIRDYIDHRFSQEADPSIIVVGDLNDGPGKELMEREYLLHDLVSNLQGEVFFARQFLNHALFDQPHNLRWTSKFKDKLDPERDEHILLDHILFTQALTRSGTSPLRVHANAGMVEHLVFETAASQLGESKLSDHRPVSLELTPRTP